MSLYGEINMTINVNKTLYDSKPQDEKSRLKKEMESYEVLEKLEIKYTRIDHEEAFTIENCNEVEKALDIKICKNLLLCNSSKNKFYMLIMPGNKKFLTKNLSKQINSSRLSFADGEYMEKFLNITPGSLSVMGLMYDRENMIKLLIDKDILNDEYFGCHPCINTSSIKVKTSDIIEKFIPYTNHDVTVVEL